MQMYVEQRMAAKVNVLLWSEHPDYQTPKNDSIYKNPSFLDMFCYIDCGEVHLQKAADCNGVNIFCVNFIIIFL